MNNTFNFTIFVNTSDGFEDCWIPFFTLLKKHWHDCKIPIFLNTEFKNYTIHGLNITCTKVHEGITERKLTWSECLIKGLEKVQTPYVLYLQEDYFFETDVNVELIFSLINKMNLNNDIKYIGLTDIGNFGPFKPYSEDSDLVIVGNNRYRISTQAAIWDKEVLLSYLLPHENGWMFEIFGTLRANKRKDLFLTVNRDLYSKNKNPIISYEHTGIIKGKWHPNIPNLFKSNKIEVNYNYRGFYKSKSRILRKMETVKNLLKNPILFFRGITGK
jgi:hypothetical protein